MRIKAFYFAAIFMAYGLNAGTIFSQSDGPVVGVSDFNLSAQQIGEYETRAKSGDERAAYELYHYFAFVKNDFKTSLFWLNRSAELNNAQAQFDLYFMYTNISSVKNPLLAQYWLKRAAKNGNAQAKALLLILTHPP